MLERWTAKYAADIGMYGSYTHDFKTITSVDLLHFDACLERSGVIGKLDGDLYHRWDPKDAAYDHNIANTITYTRFLQIKRAVKLNDNNKSPKRGEEGYDPAYKYDYAFKTICANTNAFTYEAGLDQCGDETTIAHNSFGEANSGLLGRVMGKLHVTKGMQTVLMVDTDCIRPRAYYHCHKCHPKFSNRGAEGFTRQGAC